MHPKAIITFSLLVLFFSNVAPAPGPAPAPGAGSGSVCVKPNDPNPDPSDCSKFFLCAAGKPHPMSCRDGTLYNPSVMSCDHAFNVDCHAPDPAPIRDIKKKVTVKGASKKTGRATYNIKIDCRGGNAEFHGGGGGGGCDNFFSRLQTATTRTTTIPSTTTLRRGQYGNPKGYSTTILRRGQYGNHKDYFAKSWTEYERGFGDVKKEFWLGLTKMAELTATGRWELQVLLTDYSGQTYTALYSDFSVGDSSTSYRLSLSGYNAARSTLPDSLIEASNLDWANLNGMAFSTMDNDHDNDRYSCSIDQGGGGGGWWFNACYRALLTGKNYNDKTIDSWSGIVWYTSPPILPAGGWGTWPAAEMIIRKK